MVGHQKVLDTRNFWPHTPSSRKGRGEGDGGNDPSGLWAEASIQFLRVLGSENFQLGGHIGVLGVVQPSSKETEAPVSGTLPVLTLGTCSSSLFIYIPSSYPLLYQKKKKTSKHNKGFPELCESFYQMIKPRESVTRTPVYSQVHNAETQADWHRKGSVKVSALQKFLTTTNTFHK